MNRLVMITPPVSEPVSVADMKVQLGIGDITDGTLTGVFEQQLAGYIAAARAYCALYTRSAFLTQTWLWRRDGFGHHHHEYSHHHREILLPKTPFQSLAFFKYVDTAGALQTLTQDTSYGVNNSVPYGFQLDPGSDTQPACLRSAWVRPWPPTRLVESNVLIQFKCGFGGPITGSMLLNSAVLTGPVFLPGDVGQAVTIQGAAAASAALVTTVASVDGNGQATLAAAATVAVTTAMGWAGQPVPQSIQQAIKFMAQFFYEQGSVVDVLVPRIVMALLDEHRNLVS